MDFDQVSFDQCRFLVGFQMDLHIFEIIVNWEHHRDLLVKHYLVILHPFLVSQHSLYPS